MSNRALIDWSKYLRPAGEPLPGDAFVEEGEIIRPEDLEPELMLLYENGLPGGVSVGWSVLDPYFTLQRGQFTTVTGTPGAGKSALVDNIAMNTAKRCGWKWGVFSAENLPIERHLASLSEIFIGKPFRRGFSTRMTVDELAEAQAFINEHFAMIPPRDGCTVEYVLAATDRLIVDFGLAGLILDPWNELEHARDRGMTEAEYLSQVLSRVRRFTRSRNVVVIVVAHPRLIQKDTTGTYPVAKPYDINGGAQWWNKSDCILSVWRDYSNPSTPTQVHVQKIRFREVGKLGLAELYFDTISGRFVEASVRSINSD